MNVLRTMKRGLFHVSEFLAAFSLAIMLVIVTYQVIARFMPINMPSWTEELARFLMVYIVAFAGGLAIEKKAFVGMDSFYMMFPLRVQKSLTIIFNIMTGVLFFIIMYFGYFLMLDVKGQMSPALQITMNYVYISLPLLGLNMVIFLLLDTWAAIQSIVQNKDVPISTADDHLIAFVSEEEKIQKLRETGNLDSFQG